MAAHKKEVSSTLTTEPPLILLVNDNLLQLDAMKLLLNQEGYSVRTAVNAEEAQDMLSRISPDLIISDVVMPGMTGIELCRRIKSNPALADVPILLVTGLRYDDAGISEGFEAGATDYLEIDGPITLFCRKVQNLVKQRREHLARMRVEESLRESEQRFELFMQNLPGVAFIKDSESRLVYVNKTFESLFNLTRDQWSGKSDDELWSPEIAAQFQESDRRVFESNKSLEIVETLPHKDGLHYWLSTKFPILESEEGVSLLGGISIDITNRKQVEEELRKSEQQLAQAQKIAHLGSWDWDLVTKEVGWSDEVFLLLGFRPQSVEINYELISKIFPPDEMIFARRMVEKILKDHEPFSYESKISRLDGPDLILQISGQLVRDESGNPARLLGTVQDITERKQLEGQLRQAQKMEAIGRLAGGIAHDFNNLLTAIIGYSQLALTRLERKDFPYKEMEEIQKAGERAAALTGQLLAFSRKQILQPRVIDLNIIASDMEKMIRRLIGEDITVITNLDPTPGRVRVDPMQIEQVMMNLVVNARDAMPDGGTMIIETQVVDLDEVYARHHLEVNPGRYVMLAVSDTGCGMDAATLARVFEPFFTTKEKGKGTGLGLSTVYGIIKQSGGSIMIYSEPGKGSTFKIYLPQIDAPVEQVEVLEPLPHRSSGSETILLVEDDETVRTLTRSILETSGYSVLEAASGEEAIGICDQHSSSIDMIITDVVMPKLGGPRMIEQIREKCPNMRVLFMSGYTDSAFVHHGAFDPGTPFLEKPFTPVALIRKVREVLDRTSE